MMSLATPSQAACVEIRVDAPRRTQPASLLREHLGDMALHSPPESTHALDPEALCSPEITFWTAWDGSQLVGCGALSELDARLGEIKSMRTSTHNLRRGVAASMLRHIIAEAELRSYTRRSLETGSTSRARKCGAAPATPFSRPKVAEPSRSRSPRSCPDPSLAGAGFSTRRSPSRSPRGSAPPATWPGCPRRK